MIKSITNFLIIFFIFQQLKSQISQIDQNGYNAFYDETLQILPLVQYIFWQFGYLHFVQLCSVPFYKTFCTGILLIGRIDLMHWRHVSITTTPCWGVDLSRCAHMLCWQSALALSLSVSARAPGQPGGMACRGWPAGCMLGDGARGSATFDPQRAWAPFCDVICIRSIGCTRLT